MLICELYKSIQGEGLLTGTESVFVRTSGCNLRCGFCDTPFSSWQPEGKQRSVMEIVQECRDSGCSHIVLTGGEPLLQKEVVELTIQLKSHDFHTTIETAGTVDQPVQCDLMSISPKLDNSTPAFSRAGVWTERHEQTRHRPDVIRSFLERYDYQLKFVVDQPPDCQEILEYLQQFPGVEAERVLLMPQGVEESELAKRESWIRPFCDARGFRFCQRMHIVWFGNRRGT